MRSYNSRRVSSIYAILTGHIGFNWNKIADSLLSLQMALGDVDPAAGINVHEFDL
jgi:hypothetical protein